MNTRPRSVPVTFALILFNIFIWLGFGVVVAGGFHPAIPSQPLIRTLMASLAFAIAAIFSGLLFLLARHHRSAFFLTVGLFVALSFASFFDDFGFADLVVLAFNVAPIAFLIKDRTWYLQARASKINDQGAA